MLLLVAFQRSQRLLSLVDRALEHAIQLGLFITILAGYFTLGRGDVQHARRYLQKILQQLPFMFASFNLANHLVNPYA